MSSDVVAHIGVFIIIISTLVQIFSMIITSDTTGVNVLLLTSVAVVGVLGTIENALIGEWAAVSIYGIESVVGIIAGVTYLAHFKIDLKLSNQVFKCLRN